MVLSLLLALGFVLLGRPAHATDFQSASAACDTEPFPTSGTIYYACDCQTGADPNCAAGNDSNNGTSPSTPWQSYGKVISTFASLPAGGTVAMCRGGAWSAGTTDTRVVNHNSSAAKPVTLRDYVPPTSVGHAKPRINLGGGTCLVFSEPMPSHDEGYRVLNLDCEGTATSGEQGIFLGNDVSDVFACNMTFNNMDLGVNIGGTSPTPANCYDPGPPIVDNCNFQARITIQGSTFTKIMSLGFFGSAHELGMLYNSFDHCGSDNEFDHSLYFGAMTPENSPGSPSIIPVRNERFIGNLIVDSGVAGKCDGAQVVVHGMRDGMVIQGNLFSVPTNPLTGNCYGLAVDTGGYKVEERFTNVTVDGNTIANFANNGITLANCQNCTVRNNLVMKEDATTGGNCFFIGSPLDNPYQDGETHTTVENNTCYLPIPTNSTGIVLAGQGAQNIIANNAIFFDNTTSGSQFSCFAHQLGTQALAGGSIPANPSSYASITNGGFDITISGTHYAVTGLDLSGVTGLGVGSPVSQGLASALQAKLAALAPGTIVSWQGSSLMINTAPGKGPTSITAASAPTGSGSPTDVSGMLGLSAGAGASVEQVYAAEDYNLCFAPSGPKLAWDSPSGNSLTAWTTAVGFDMHSLVAAPQFVNAALASGDFTPAAGSPLIGAGSSMYYAAQDINGTVRAVPPDIGAVQRTPGIPMDGGMGSSDSGVSSGSDASADAPMSAGAEGGAQGRADGGGDSGTIAHADGSTVPESGGASQGCSCDTRRSGSAPPTGTLALGFLVLAGMRRGRKRW
jgi:parallel beta-helix repeat protein